jgi:polyisoprenoid-binding protein YceI
LAFQRTVVTAWRRRPKRSLSPSGPEAPATDRHDLLIEVGSWTATLQIADDPAATALRLSADARSDDVLQGAEIQFRSGTVENGDGETMRVTGDLTLLGKQVSFEGQLPPS